MKHLFTAVTNCTTTQLCLIIIAGTFLFSSCTKQDLNQPKNETQTISNASISSDADLVTKKSKTVQELELARKSTEKYKDINNAIADGYIDINVVMPNMGYHYENPSLVDSVFDITHPELLVYNKNVDGSFRLVAVEYAIPLDASADAPKGFTGQQDVWDHNTDFGLWLLHAWVYDYNPDGVFNPTNSRVNVIIP